MKLWLLIPVKPFLESKSRLSPVLDAGERAALSRQLLEGTIALAQQSGRFHEILVISRDAAARAIAQHLGVKTLTEKDVEKEVGSQSTPGSKAAVALGAGASPLDAPTSCEPASAFISTRMSASRPAPEMMLNRALSVGRQHALDAGAEAVLVLPADLPLLEPGDLDTLIAPLYRPSVSTSATVILAPSQDGGTNALLLHPPTAIPFAFGGQSFARHRALAERAGCAVTIVRTPSLIYDLDLPEDLWGEDLGI